MFSSVLPAAAPVVQPADASGVFTLLVVVIALPALGAAVLLLGGRRTDRWGHLLGCATVGLSFVISVVLFVSLLGRDDSERSITQPLWTWFSAGSWTVRFDLLYDPLSALFLLLITGVGGLIHLYSVGYMEHDDRRRRFFAYLNLFVAAMLVLVLAGDYVGLFLGWEGVGLASYLLIGFWQYKPTAAAAAKKAFVINRVGDIGMALGVGALIATFGTTSFTGVSRMAPPGLGGLAHRDRLPAPARGLRQVGAVPAAHLAARRDGGPDPGLGPDPRGDDGDGRGLPDHPVELDLRQRPLRSHRRDRDRLHHPAARRDHRVRQGRHQEGPRRAPR